MQYVLHWQPLQRLGYVKCLAQIYIYVYVYMDSGSFSFSACRFDSIVKANFYHLELGIGLSVSLRVPTRELTDKVQSIFVNCSHVKMEIRLFSSLRLFSLPNQHRSLKCLNLMRFYIIFWVRGARASHIALFKHNMKRYVSIWSSFPFSVLSLLSNFYSFSIPIVVCCLLVSLIYCMGGWVICILVDCNPYGCKSVFLSNNYVYNAWLCLQIG